MPPQETKAVFCRFDRATVEALDRLSARLTGGNLNQAAALAVNHLDRPAEQWAALVLGLDSPERIQFVLEAAARQLAVATAENAQAFAMHDWHLLARAVRRRHFTGQELQPGKIIAALVRQYVNEEVKALEAFAEVGNVKMAGRQLASLLRLLDNLGDLRAWAVILSVQHYLDVMHDPDRPPQDEWWTVHARLSMDGGPTG